MKKILVATEKPFSKETTDYILDAAKGLNVEVVLLEKYGSRDELYAALKDVEGLIVRSDKIDQEAIDAAPKLEVIVRGGAGYDNIDCAYAKEKGIVVMNTPGQNANAVAELTFGLLLMMTRKKYSGKQGFEISGKKMGILGYGNIGRRIANYALGFNMEVEACDIFLKPGETGNEKVAYCPTVKDLFANCQVISLNIPATEETKKSIGYDLLMSMPKNAVVINTARKEVIDEEGLAKALSERTDLYYVADIAPANAQELVEEFGDQVFFTAKKLGAQTEEANFNAGRAALNQSAQYLNEKVADYQVNK
ncbi:3-phosphoglycerate dehydrogenase [Halosquirtibacter xylanolyticus]|uniref:NAD(P)-dependent oxidoreductase n=1 Tax=Halosquirtibacter xylanolyticus TaxID=3374599 RepID=UPI003748C8D4|nr:3-phosphoglycerate dehydrogenase [Prolixibacteraceae bacterium]